MVHWAIVTFLHLLLSVAATTISTLDVIVDEAPEGVDGGATIIHVLDAMDNIDEQDQQPHRPSEKEFDQSVILKKTKPEPCDFESWIYSLVHYTDRNSSNSGYFKPMTDDCSRPFIVQRIFNSNMVLLVVNSICWESRNVSAKMTDPVQVDYNMSLACHRVLFNNFTRRHYMSCINRNANESQIKLCGGAPHIGPSIILLFASIFIAYV